MTTTSNGGLKVGDKVRVPLEGGDWHEQERSITGVVFAFNSNGNARFRCDTPEHAGVYYGDIGHPSWPLERVEAAPVAPPAPPSLTLTFSLDEKTHAALTAVYALQDAIKDTGAPNDMTALHNIADRLEHTVARAMRCALRAALTNRKDTP